MSGAERSRRYHAKHPERRSAYIERTKEARRAYSAAYYKRPEVQRRLREYYERPEIQKARAKYRATPEFKRRSNERMRRHGECPEFRKRRRATRLRQQYGITQDWYSTRYAAGCEICLRPFSDERPAQIDHDRRCCSGKVSCRQCVRGLVCGPCNRDGLVGIDYLIDVGGLERAIAYAKSHRKDGKP